MYKVAPIAVRYSEVARKNEGMWFALSRDGELLAIAKDNRKLWKKIREKLGDREIDVVIGYSQTKKERETACLLLSPSMNVD